MQAREILDYLEDLADAFGVEIVHEKLGQEDFRVRGGLCKVKGAYKVFLDRSETIEGQISVLAKALSESALFVQYRGSVYSSPYQNHSGKGSKVLMKPIPALFF
jgi:hypothetical protein